MRDVAGAFGAMDWFYPCNFRIETGKVVAEDVEKLVERRISAVSDVVYCSPYP
jgi:hypothetical protein